MSMLTAGCRHQMTLGTSVTRLCSVRPALSLSFQLSFLVHLNHLVAHSLAQQTFQSLLSVATEQARKRDAAIPRFKGGQSSLPETSNWHMAETRLQPSSTSRNEVQPGSSLCPARQPHPQGGPQLAFDEGSQREPWSDQSLTEAGLCAENRSAAVCRLQTLGTLEALTKQPRLLPCPAQDSPGSCPTEPH